ncbi:acetyl-CoA acetyltransferase [Rhabdothermincola sediminis]|uniref:acetyl-CoA acetyltransferase n=1 Tax=Rhabdothermincola sediminis TaxID=2751370 RepID=UPI001AA06FF4|nr:acetyl-CoA acetyltransferase [Rhabdothermincola sediminis]
MSVDPRAPCIIGVGQQVWRPGGGEAPEPLAMWEQVCRQAADDAGAARGAPAVLAAVDSLDVVYCQSWAYDDPPGRLAEALAIDPRRRAYSGIGGTVPQQLVDAAAEAIIRGELDVALVTGAEALDTRRRLRKDGRKPAWRFKDPERKPFPFEAPFHPAEVAHEVFQAWLTFAVFDIGRRARLGTSPEEHRRRLGELLAPFTRVAARNPFAWFPVERSVEELITPSAQNRMVGYPYTKYMVSVMDVDMAAAVIVASHARADSLGVPAERRVYLRGWCYATDPLYVAEHRDLSRSPAMAAASAEALRVAGVGVDDVAHLDLYSCFASSVDFARDALGLAPDDPRGLTVTGGLPFAGGAGSGYLAHSIASMAVVLREDPGSFGLVSGVGMHMTKHAFGLYSTSPGPVMLPEVERVQRRLDAEGPAPIVDTHRGPATVAAYSVAHGRDGEPGWALLVCEFDGGARCYARATDPDLLVALEVEEWVGRVVELETTEGDVNLARA